MNGSRRMMINAIVGRTAAELTLIISWKIVRENGTVKSSKSLLHLDLVARQPKRWRFVCCCYWWCCCLWLARAPTMPNATTTGLPSRNPAITPSNWYVFPLDRSAIYSFLLQFNLALGAGEGGELGGWWGRAYL